MAELSKQYLKQRRRKATVIAIAVVAAAAVAAIVLLIINSSQDDDVPASPYYAEVYDDAPNSFALYDPDAPSIFTDESYLSLDRSIHVKRGGEEYAVTDRSSELADEATRFFFDYFDALSHGECERYRAFFTDGYYEKHEKQEDFSEQRVYDICLTLLDETDDARYVSYIVEYKISKNNGTFRRDIYSDSVRPLIFDLVRDGESYKIDNLHYLNG